MRMDINNARELLNIRRKCVMRMKKCGYSEMDIARFYEINQDSIALSVQEGTPVEEDFYQFAIPIEELLDWRDRILSQAEDKEATLFRMGFDHSPEARKKRPEIKKTLLGVKNDLTIDYIEWAIGRENTDFDDQSIKEYCQMVGIPVSDLAFSLKTDKLLREDHLLRGNIVFNLVWLNRVIKALENIDEKLLIYELYQCTFKTNEIREYMGVSEEKLSELSNPVINKINYKKNVDWNHLENDSAAQFLKGRQLYRNEIVELTGKRETTIRKMTELLGLPSPKETTYTAPGQKKFDHKGSAKLRREMIFKMYNEDKMTQQEIADALGLTRTTVGSDIRKYEREYPEKVDCTILYQQRNVASDLREKSNKERLFIEILVDQCPGISVGEIQKITGASANRITYCLLELGYQTPGQQKKQQRKDIIFDEIKRGFSVEEVSEIHNWSISYVNKVLEEIPQNIQRTVELKQAYQMPPTEHHGPTTAIMETLNKTRANVLYDQRLTGSKMRGDAAFKQLVKENYGDLVKQTKDYYKPIVGSLRKHRSKEEMILSKTDEREP